MSRFVFATLGSLGDLHPYVAVARALAERGHQVVIATSEYHRADVERADIEFAPAGPSIPELDDYPTLVRKVLDVRSGPEYLIRHLIMPHVRSSYEDLSRASSGADLLISHPLTFALPLVAQKSRLRWAATVLFPLGLMSCYDPPVIPAAPWLTKLRVLGPKPHRLLFSLLKRVARKWEAPLRALREDLGLPPSGEVAMFEGQFSPLRNLGLFDPQLAEPQPDWPPHLRVCGAPIYDGVATDPGLREELERFLAAGEAPIVFALGSSAVWMAGDFWDQAAAAARQLGRRAILVTGPVKLENLPEGVRAFPYVPYSMAFPRAAAVVHPAGIGTLAQTMRAGCPQLIVPVAFDQPDNALRAAKLGLARVLPFKKVTAGRLASELAILLARPEYSREARAIAGALAKTDGAARAADELVACIRPDHANPALQRTAASG